MEILIVLFLLFNFKKMYTFMPNGAVFVMKNYTKWTNNMGLYVMPQDRSIDIDLEEDFELAEILMKKNVKKLKGGEKE